MKEEKESCLFRERERVGMTSRTRLFRELKEIQQRTNASEGIEITPNESNIFHWNAVLKVRKKRSRKKEEGRAFLGRLTTTTTPFLITPILVSLFFFPPFPSRVPRTLAMRTARSGWI